MALQQLKPSMPGQAGCRKGARLKMQRFSKKAWLQEMSRKRANWGSYSCSKGLERHGRGGSQLLSRYAA